MKFSTLATVSAAAIATPVIAEVNEYDALVAASAYQFINTHFTDILAYVAQNPTAFPPVALLGLYQSLKNAYGDSNDFTTDQAILDQFPTAAVESWLAVLPWSFSVPAEPTSSAPASTSADVTTSTEETSTTAAPTSTKETSTTAAPTSADKTSTTESSSATATIPPAAIETGNGGNSYYVPVAGALGAAMLALL